MKQWSLETVPGNPACCRGRAAVHEEKEERAPFAVAAWARAAPRRPRSGESPGGAGGPPRAEVGGAGCGAGSGAWGVGGREGARVGPAAGRAAAGLRVGPALAEADPGRSRRAGERGGGVAGRWPPPGRSARPRRGGRAGRARELAAGSGPGAGPAAWRRRGRCGRGLGLPPAPPGPAGEACRRWGAGTRTSRGAAVRGSGGASGARGSAPSLVPLPALRSRDAVAAQAPWEAAAAARPALRYSCGG